MWAASQCLPQLQDLNISWCAGVTDWGVIRLCNLSNLTNLNLGATSIKLESSDIADHLRKLSNLKCLNLDRCGVQAAGLAAVAAALTGPAVSVPRPKLDPEELCSAEGPEAAELPDISRCDSATCLGTSRLAPDNPV